MNLQDFLREKRAAVLKRWLDSVLLAYPQQTAEFLKNRKNQFANPVGQIITDGISGMLDSLIAGLDTAGGQAHAGEFGDFLDNLVKVRAVQEFSASAAVGFIFSLKKAVRAEIADLGEEGNGLSAEMEAFDESVDRLALAAFDAYAKCRERIFELKTTEFRNMTFRLLQQAKVVVDTGEGDGSGDTEEKAD